MEETVKVLVEIPKNMYEKITNKDNVFYSKIIANGTIITNEQGWIPVSERLPENGQSVLFCDIDNDIMVGYHVKGRPETHFSQDGTYEDIKDVRAWMPLPEPYGVTQ